ncbi:MAG TPA: metal-dependent hydrolase [Acidiferrobacterales bacterium]|nr:metal-dependent hydrolase [Acidiferrobacterales bacterium]
MFIGHFSVGFGAKRFAPRVSLGTLFLAAQFIDLLWPTLLLFGVEQVRVAPGITAFTPLDFEHYPWSHSLFMVIVWGALFGAVYCALRRDARASAVLAMAVFSHWLLDFLTHRPDPPLWPDGVPVWVLGSGIQYPPHWRWKSACSCAAFCSMCVRPVHATPPATGRCGHWWRCSA